MGRRDPSGNTGDEPCPGLHDHTPSARILLHHTDRRALAQPLPHSPRPEQSNLPLPEGCLLAPANPGGGWDQTARQLQQVLTAEDILGVSVEVVNRGGAGGTIGLADMVTRYRDDPRTLMVFGQVMLGSIRTNRSPVSIGDTTPLARLLSEYEVVAVPADSRYRTLPELMDEFRRDPESISWAGGSAGGIDHILGGLLAQAAGVDPGQANYDPR